ncbi:NAD(P)-dependent oxidoreductase [Desulfosarcina widdelii]|uniref:NAD(P)-dependent oxidoreductase n=1 Tax=Desulfosarcina widdelii TaxID=947919 RepID=A0A5K7YZY7_9BACT|nr:SDR family oxidoreductase [Desulfosarcina widdelii]BBO74188.1 NAD(P)-dependent oxidoreductase [Desulfosarcina widdelii]
MKALNGKIVVITGGAAGIGREMALAFAREEACLVLLDIDPDQLDATVAELTRNKAAAKGYRCDVSNPEEVGRVAAKILEEFEHVDVLVNNAGIVIGKPAAEVSYEELRRIVDINALGVMWMTRQFLGKMMTRNSGHIVNIASASGLLGVPRQTDYCATKFAVVGYSDALRMEMKKYGCRGVKISCICPSVIDTGMFAGFTPPLLNPLLKPADVACKIVRTVKREKDYLKIPFMVKMIPFFKVLPPSWVDWMVALTGTNNAMDHFVGRRSEVG